MKIAITLAGLLLVAACGGVPAAPPTGTAVPSPQATAAAPSERPASERPPGPASVPETAERPSDPPVTRPPDGMLHAGDAAVPGWLGTYCWTDHCVDGPPGADKETLPLARTDGGELTFRLADSSLFGEWVASYADEPGGELTEVARGGEFDPDVSGASPSVGEAKFAAPPPGDGVVHVQIFAPDGDAAYWWHVITE